MKLAALTIRNFGCFDKEGCTIKIDDIIVLIGQNNIGKSSILDAYEAFASMGSKLPITFFKDENSNNPISIEGIFTNIEEADTEVLGKACVYNDLDYGEVIKVKFEWLKPDENGKKYTYDGERGGYKLGGSGGWDTLLQSRIPAPLRIRPTDTPAELEKVVTDILIAAIKQRVKSDNSKIEALVQQVRKISEQYAIEIEDEIGAACDSISSKLQSVFPTYSVKFVPDGKLEAEKILGAGSHIRLFEHNRPPLPLKTQGSGLQRTFLWSAISALAEIGKLKQGRAALSADKPRILLIDEPEAFLHPQSIRSAREALYKLAEIENWQVMASTHSPIFIDVSKPHTTIIRLERNDCHSTKVVSTDRLNFSEEERARLAMVRSCHPTVNEFFFADTIILVEGETEHLVFTILFQEAKVENFHVVNCLGKGNIQLFAKILNHFNIKYVAVHDSDCPKALRADKWVNNPAWKLNQNILEVTLNNPKGAYCITHIPDFEGYYFDKRFKTDKPFSAYKLLTSEEFKTLPTYEGLKKFVEHLMNDSHPNKYSDPMRFSSLVSAWIEEKNPEQKDMWQFE
ncbi:ATP-dependent nuclease [Pseudocnuella soli]|uniref:ATP-dependent nuclease n=1 Tax=Pseudocnuella soli TaxID=2502779 RepID=UPI001043218D|nr:AAA family ATPase [Pseudocnuella soli]